MADDIPMFGKKETMVRVKEIRCGSGIVHVDLVCNNTAAYVGIDERGGYQVCPYPISQGVWVGDHKSDALGWPGGGKYFARKADAIGSYRSSEMKAIIEAATEAATGARLNRG